MSDETPLTAAELDGIEHDLRVGTGGVPYLSESGLNQRDALRLLAEVRRLRALRAAVLRYDEALIEKARDGRSWTASPELDRLYEAWLTLCGDVPLDVDPGIGPGEP